MATIDMTHRKLNFPPRFLPYLEKHRIFELFHECVELLVQVKPKDHIQFLKNIMPCAAKRKNKQRVVFLSPIPFDRKAFSELIADCLGIQCINLMYMGKLAKKLKEEEKLKIQVSSESTEEESCVCPEEEPGESTFFPIYYPPGGEELFPSESQESDESLKLMKSLKSLKSLKSRESHKAEYEGEEKQKKPCICVCPCVDNYKNHEKGKHDENDGKDRVDENKEKRDREKEEENEKETEKEEEEEKEEEKKKEEEKEKEEEEKEKEEKNTEKEEEEEEEKDDDDNDKYPSKPYQQKTKIHSPEPKTISLERSSTESSSAEIDFGLLADCEVSAKGWILQDFPLTGEDAEKLNSLGVIPTHAVRIILDEVEEAKNQDYKLTVSTWMRAYKYVPVMEIRIREREISELAKDMCSLLSVMPHRHAPMLPRVVLIGSRGSGVTTQGQKLARKYGMVHVEFEIVIAQALQQDDELSKLYKVQLATRPDPELEAFILERALLTSACRNRGWVLTGYPRNIDQMRMLDIIATPPNRVIFIEVPARECFVRLYYRKIDPCLGDEYKIPKIEPSGLDSFETTDLDPEIAARLLSHPKNNKKQIIHDIEQYFLEKKDIMTYCGKTASYVDGNHTVDGVFELIEQVLINPAPGQPPRNPLAINHGIKNSYERLKKFRLASGMYFNNLLLNPPEQVERF